MDAIGWTQRLDAEVAEVGHRGWTQRLAKVGHIGWMQRLDTEVGCRGWMHGHKGWTQRLDAEVGCRGWTQ